MSEVASRNRFPIAVVATLLINAFLFAGLPLLTRVTEHDKPQGFESPIMIAHIKPPKPLFLGRFIIGDTSKYEVHSNSCHSPASRQSYIREL